MFFTLGFAINVLTMGIALIYSVYFQLFIARRTCKPLNLSQTNFEVLAELEQSEEKTRNLGLVDTPDTHGLLLHVGLAPETPNPWPLAAAIDPTHTTLYRYVDEEGGHKEGPSSDMLIGWAAYYDLIDVDPVYKKNLLKLLTNKFIKNVFTLNTKDGGLSDRASSGGVAPTHTGWPVGKKLLGYTLPWGLMLPATSQVVLPALALLSLASKHLGWKYRVVKAVYNFVSMGWFWKRVPYLYTKTEFWYYTSHISAMSLNVIHNNSSSVGEQKAAKAGMKWIIETARIGPNNINPFIAGWCGPGISNESKTLAIQILSQIDHAWPQHRPGSDGFLKVKDNPKGLTSLRKLAYHQLK